jgi:hypothetical protein
MYSPCNVANTFGKWLNGMDHTFKILIRMEVLVVIWSLWLCRNDKVSIIEVLILDMLLTGAQLCSFHGRLYNVRRIATCLCRCLHGWRPRRGIFFIQHGSVIFGLVLLHLMCL